MGKLMRETGSFLNAKSRICSNDLMKQRPTLLREERAMNKMETRIRELESEIDAENRRMADALKNLRKSERRIKEMSYATDEDRKNHERMQALVDQLQSKIKTYKKQIE